MLYRYYIGVTLQLLTLNKQQSVGDNMENSISEVAVLKATQEFKKYLSGDLSSYKLKRAGGGFTTAAKRSLKSLIEAKKAHKGKPVYFFDCALEPKLKAKISLTEELKNIGQERITAKNPRKQNTEVRSGFRSVMHEEGFEYKNKFKGYMGSYLICEVQSYGILADDKKSLGYVVDGKKGFIDAPHGYSWELDNEQIVLIKNSSGDEYHIEGKDLNLTPTQISKKLRDNAALRKKQLAALKAKNTLEKQKKDAISNKIVKILERSNESLVEVAHSYKVGNCVAGTKKFLKDIGLLKAGSDSLKSFKACDIKKHFLSNRYTVSEMQIKRFYLALLHFEKSLKKTQLGN